MEWLVPLAVTAAIGALTIYFLLKKANREPPPKPQPQTSGNISIYFSSETGEAESLANQLASEAQERLFNPILQDLNSFNIFDFTRQNYCIIICTTTPEGQPPESAIKFIKWLKRCIEEKTYKLKKLNYCLFGLGQDNFEASMTIDKYLKEMEARPMMTQGFAHSNVSIYKEFREWSNQLWTLLLQRGKRSDNYLEVLYNVPLIPSDPNVKYGLDMKNYMEADLYKISLIKELKRDPEDSALHLEIDCDKPYTPAQSFGIFPENDEELVIEIASLQDYDLDMTFAFVNNGEKPVPFPTPCTVRDALVKYCDLTGLISKVVLKKLSSYAADEDKQKLEHLASLKGKSLFRSQIQEKLLTLGDIFKIFPTLKVPFEDLIQIVGRIKPRYYTISSSQLEHPNKLHLTATIVKEKTGEGKVHTGLCSGYFQQMYITYLYSNIRGFFKNSAFNVPNLDGPIYMVGIGAGIAPFRGILQHIRAIYRQEGQRDIDINLYYGVKGKTQFLYQKEIEDLIAPNAEELAKFEHRPTQYSEGPYVLSKLYVVYSRDYPKKVYVQDLLFRHQEQLWNALYEQNGSLLVCGRNEMCKAVMELVNSIATEALGEEAGEYLDKLMKSGRYAVEAWGQQQMVLLQFSQKYGHMGGVYFLETSNL